jgi:hypothetical protein
MVVWDADRVAPRPFIERSRPSLIVPGLWRQASGPPFPRSSRENQSGRFRSLGVPHGGHAGHTVR